MELYEKAMTGKFGGYLICTDYDGTFAQKGEPVQANLEAVRYFVENGGYFTIASGRSVNFLREKGLHRLINAPASLCNGSVVYDYREDRLLRQRFLPYTLADISQWISPLAATVTGINVFSDPFDSGELYENLEVAAKRLGDPKPLKLLCRFPTEEAADVFRDFAIRHPELRHCCISKSWGLGVELNAADASKGHALRFLKDHLESVHTTIGVGNYDNDLSLLVQADIGAAPYGSLPSVLDQARWILSPCQEGSILDLIQRLEKEIDK